MFLLELRHVEVEYTGIQGIRDNQYKQWSNTLLIVTFSFHTYFFLAHSGLNTIKKILFEYICTSQLLWSMKSSKMYFFLFNACMSVHGGEGGGGGGAPDTEEILNHWASQYGAHRNWWSKPKCEGLLLTLSASKSPLYQALSGGRFHSGLK